MPQACDAHDFADPGLTALSTALGRASLRGTIEEELPGGASTRRFFRIRLERGTTIVGMYVPMPSQELSKARQAARSTSFVEVQALLMAHGIRVPHIISHHPEQAVILVEDLGDETLAEYLKNDPASAPQLYLQAVSDLADAQRKLQALPQGSLVRGRAFDHDLLRWELEHFRTWALEARGLVLSSRESKTWEEVSNYIAQTISSWPRGFVHRDYQSRNLMVRSTGSGRSLTWIDFQDAMLGPRAYDLVALLTDSYQSFERSFVEARLNDYLRALGDETSFEQLAYEFDFITIQRKLKDAGRFVFIHHQNNNDRFLPYVESTVRRARSALGRLASRDEELKKLEDVFTRLLD